MIPAGIEQATFQFVAQHINHCYRGPHIFIVGNVYCNAMNVVDEIVSYIKMEVL